MEKKDVVMVKREMLYDGHFKMMKLYLKHTLFEGGWTDVFAREMYERGDAVTVLLYDPKFDSVVLLEQFRAGALERDISPWLFEIVAGVIEPNENLEEVAVRETLEESGIQIDLKNLHFICDFFPSPGGSMERVYLYCALVDSTNQGGVFGVPAEHENIKVYVVPRTTAFKWVSEGKIKTSMTIIALQWLELNKHLFKMDDERRARTKNRREAEDRRKGPEERRKKKDERREKAKDRRK